MFATKKQNSTIAEYSETNEALEQFLVVSPFAKQFTVAHIDARAIFYIHATPGTEFFNNGELEVFDD